MWERSLSNTGKNAICLKLSLQIPGREPMEELAVAFSMYNLLSMGKE